jgi:hypothetical protein
MRAKENKRQHLQGERCAGGGAGDDGGRRREVIRGINAKAHGSFGIGARHA